jgi:cell division protein FtsB
MTARRGSLVHKITRLTRLPRRDGPPSRRRRFARIAATVAGRSLITLAVLLASGTVAIQVWHATARNMQLRQQIGQIEADNTSLTATNAKLEMRVTRLHDPEYLVPLIHEQLGLAKPHEVFVEVTQATPAPK